MRKRKLLMAERIMYVNAQTPLNCVFTARIKGSISEENFRYALVKIQQKHPLLRAVIDESEEQNPNFVLTDEVGQIPVRIVPRQADDDWLLESRIEWPRLFDDPKNPLVRIVWIRGSQVSDILLIVPHCICDGSGGMTLISELLCLIDDPALALEPYRMFDSVNDFLPKDFNIKKHGRKARISMFVARLIFFIKRQGKKRIESENYAIHWKLDADLTKAVIQNCKSNGVTVHARLCAAFIEAFRLVRKNSAKGKVISPVDIRNFIPEIKKDHLFAFAPTVELSLKKNTLNQLEKTKQIKTELIEKIQTIKAREMLWMGEQMHRLTERVISMLKTTRGGHDITISNMGKIDIPNQFKTFELETVFSPTVAFPWLNSNTLVTSTFNGQMDFSFMANEHFLSQEEAMKIKDKAMELLKGTL